MNRALKIFVVTVAAALAASAAVPASAQGELRCESLNGRRQECGFLGAGTVQLSQELSSDACIKGQSWGVDGNTIWVDRGCRAEFLIADNGGTYRDRGPSQAMQTVVCESRGSAKRSYCSATNRFGMGLTREISRNKCVLNQTWGSDPNGVWVSNGCRAEFGLKTRS